jgi:predicted PurR-regulated permease PerM
LGGIKARHAPPGAGTKLSAQALIGGAGDVAAHPLSREHSMGVSGGRIEGAIKRQENRAAPVPDDAAPEAAVAEEVEEIGEAINLQTVVLTIIAGLLILFTIYAARAVVMPLVLACMLNLVLTPVVLALARIRIPEPLGAAIVVVIFLLMFGFGISTLAEPAAGWLRRLPFIIDQLSDRLDFLQAPAEQLKSAEEALTNLGAGGPPSEATQVVVLPRTSLRDLLINETSRFALGALTTLALLYFMLAMGDKFLRRLVAALPDFRTKKQAVEIAHQLQRDMSHYLMTVTAINIGLGATVAGSMMLTGMPNPLLWGVMVGLINYIPFLGHTVSAIVIAVVALLSFPDLGEALIPPGIFIVLATLEGNVITPMILARRLTLNPVAVVAALLIWGWMWGIVGMLLAVPLLVVIKITCDQIARLRPVGEFLGG